MTPALLTSKAIGPRSSRELARAAAPPGVDRSQKLKSAVPPAAVISETSCCPAVASRAATTTSKPRSARPWHTADPRPPVAPVTIARPAFCGTEGGGSCAEHGRALEAISGIKPCASQRISVRAGDSMIRRVRRPLSGGRLAIFFQGARFSSGVIHAPSNASPPWERKSACSCTPQKRDTQGS